MDRERCDNLEIDYNEDGGIDSAFCTMGLSGPCKSCFMNSTRKVIPPLPVAVDECDDDVPF